MFPLYHESFLHGPVTVGAHGKVFPPKSRHAILFLFAEAILENRPPTYNLLPSTCNDMTVSFAELVPVENVGKSFPVVAEMAAIRFLFAELSCVKVPPTKIVSPDFAMQRTSPLFTIGFHGKRFPVIASIAAKPFRVTELMSENFPPMYNTSLMVSK